MRIGAILLTTLVMGCATGPKLPITQPIVSFVPASAERHHRFDRPDLVEIRTIQRDGVRWSEIGGASCTMTANGLSQTFEPPVLVKVPLYYGRTRSLFVQCRATINGRSRVSGTTVDPTNLSEPDDEGFIIGVGSDGPSVGGVISIRNRNKDRFDYQHRINITFAP